jgi:tetratricopeptide (TPR) repeat protein
MSASDGMNVSLIEAIAAYKARRYGEAETGCDDVLRAAPRDAAALQLKALLAHLRGDLRAARAAIEASLAIRPQHRATRDIAHAIAKSLAARAETARLEGDAEASIADFHAALELDPALSPVWYSLGLALQTRREFGLAADAFARAVALEPGDAKATVNRGISLQQAGDLEGAWTCYRSAYRMDPSTFAVISQALPAGDVGVLILDLQILRDRLAG